MDSRLRIGLLLLILVMAWLGRLYALGDDSLWGDEILSIDRASQADLRTAWRMTVMGNHPPLYDIGVLHTWLKLGGGEFLSRFPGAFFGTLTVAALYALGKAVCSARVGVLSALLLAVSPLHIYHSREARMYGLLACLITFAVYCLQEAIRSSPSSRSYWMGFTLFGASSLYTHYYAGFTLLSLAGYMSIRLVVDRDVRLLKRWGAASLGTLAAFCPWLPILRFQIRNQPVPWIPSRSLPEVLTTPTYFFVRRELVSEKVWHIVLSGVWTALAFSCTILLFWRSNRARLRDQRALLLFSVLGTFLMAFLSSAWRPLIVTRYFTGILPVTCLLVVLGASRLRPRCLAAPLLAGLVAVSTFSSYWIATASWHEDWRAVTSHIETNALAHDVVLLFFPVAPEFWRMPFDHYYDGGLKVWCLKGEWSDTEGLGEILDGLGPHDRVWVIQSSRFTSGAPLVEREEKVFAAYDVFSAKRFERRSALSSRAVDVLCLTRHSQGN
jgi:4-amino-4-deoxy-L-arabinose transferase-like glycosyltransferase